MCVCICVADASGKRPLSTLSSFFSGKYSAGNPSINKGKLARLTMFGNGRPPPLRPSKRFLALGYLSIFRELLDGAPKLCPGAKVGWIVSSLTRYRLPLV